MVIFLRLSLLLEKFIFIDFLSLVEGEVALTLVPSIILGKCSLMRAMPSLQLLASKRIVEEFIPADSFEVVFNETLFQKAFKVMRNWVDFMIYD